MKSINSCWVCDSYTMRKIKESKIKNISSSDFQITNKDYGETLSLFKCSECGFIQCDENIEVGVFYEDMKDETYEETRSSRKIQSKKILKLISSQISLEDKSLLDVGAGSGTLVEEAYLYKCKAVGIEPSKYLHSKAISHNLDVKLGVLPNDEISNDFDIITLVDVIEHVTDPSDLLMNINKVLKNNGYLVLVTPDVNSLFARILKFKWWHFRVAHVGYFNKDTLDKILIKNGFEIVKTKRPVWYFPISYLINRLLVYINPKISIRIPKIVDFIIPLNLYDSLLVVCKKI